MAICGPACPSSNTRLTKPARTGSFSITTSAMRAASASIAHLHVRGAFECRDLDCV